MIGHDITNRKSRIYSAIQYIGTHSYNIFLFHTFIFLYYFNKFIYSFKLDVLIFLARLTTCLAISIALNKLMDIMKTKNLTERINLWGSKS